MKTENTTQGEGCLPRFVRLSDVDPKKNPAFSPNLYRWLRKNKTYLRCGVDRYVCEDGIEYIGWVDDTGCLIGSRLIGALCYGGREKTWAHMHLGKSAKLKPLWGDYLNIGRCAIDPEHSARFIDERFIETGKKRTCKWCGHVQKKEFYQVTETRERWIS